MPSTALCKYSKVHSTRGMLRIQLHLPHDSES